MTSDVLPGGLERPGESVVLQVEQTFKAQLAARGYHADPTQQAAIELLSRWLEGWLRGRRGWLRAPNAGLYLWGGVGRGKSFVMDAFYAAAPVKATRRVHFHAFVQAIQQRLKQVTGRAGPLALIASEIAADTRLLCFDEFHIHDVGDAILLGRLLTHLVEQRVGLVATSNYAPRALCPNPLYRDRFKPARPESGFVWSEFAQVADNGRADWVEQRLQLSATAECDVRVEMNNRPLCLRARHQASAWVTFGELCRLPRSSADFLWLSRTFGITCSAMA